MIYRITHQTAYRYTEPVSLCHNEARLLPRSFSHQTCLNSGLSIDPAPVAYRERADFFGNRTACFSIEQPHQALSVTAVSTVRLHVLDRPAATMAWNEVRDQVQRDPGLLDVRQFVLPSPMAPLDPDLYRYAQSSFPEGRACMEAVQELIARIYADFEYVPGFTTIATPVSEVFKHRRGVCQDFAHLAIGCLRALGLAARYVSGYLETLPPPGQVRLEGADASHAWFSVYIPDIGWRDFDPTNNVMPADQHITLAWGRDFSDVTPIKGVLFGSGQHELDVAVDVERFTDR